MNKKSDINKEKKREGIIVSTKELIIERGYQKTNVEDITSRINIAKGSFYTYFKSKDQLIITILEESYRAIAEKNRETREKDLTFEGLLEYAVERKFKLNEEEAFRILFFYHLTMNLESLSREITEKLIEIKNLNIKHWYEIINRHSKELKLLSDRDKERYAEYIDELLTLTLKNTLYYGKNKDGNIFISDINSVLEKIDEKSTVEEMRFLIENIQKFFK